MEKQHAEQIKELSQPDLEMLSQAMEAFNKATEKLQTSYEILQEETKKLREEVEDKNRRLIEMSDLLDSVLNNTRSAIVVIDNTGQCVIKNRSGEAMLSSLSNAELANMLSGGDGEAVYDYEDNGRFYRISIGELQSGNLQGSIYVIDDITRLKELEIERNRGEKLVLMGEMAANIAHEIRNPLGSMELFASLLERDLADNPQSKRLASNIIRAVRVINRTISNILLFTKELQIKKEVYYLSDIVDEVILYLKHTLGEKGVSIINSLGENHMVCCDKDMFRQVVMNIVHNAIDAVGDSGSITIESCAENGITTLSVTDSGKGLSESVKKNLFIPFQTTKAKGTGLGLSIAYKIIKAHGGEILADSDGKSYTRFNIILPDESTEAK